MLHSLQTIPRKMALEKGDVGKYVSEKMTPIVKLLTRHALTALSHFLW